MTVRLLPAPCADPPYDRVDHPEPASHDHRRPHSDQRPLPLLFVLPSGVPADPVFDRQRTGTGELPDPGTWVARLARATASNWSSKMTLESYNKRPIKVLLPSSTLPAVLKRSNSIGMVASAAACILWRAVPVWESVLSIMLYLS
jgi:hypothetical protein